MNADTINVSAAVGFIPRLNSWAFASKLCNGLSVIKTASTHLRGRRATLSVTPAHAALLTPVPEQLFC